MIGYSQPIVAERPTRLTAPARPVGPLRSGFPASTWLVGFVVFLLAAQVILVFIDQLSVLIGGSGPLRILVRMGTYGASLLLLFLLPGRGWRHPAMGPAVVALWIVGISILHPTTNTLLSGIAQAALYVAILAPLFWVSRLRIDITVFRRVALVLWGFHTLSAGLGIIQVYFPGSFQPSLSAMISSYGDDYVDSLRMTTASGAQVFRPMGLTDVPGGSALSGFYAVLFGMGFLLTGRHRWLKIACVVSMGAGMMVLYLAQMRSMLLLTLLCILVFSAMLAIRRQYAKLSVLTTVLAAVVIGGFVAAVSIGGESVTNRLATLTEDRATEVYQSNRGRFLEYTVDELLPRYPLGAGLGRWGQMNVYFGNDSDPERAPIWAEIQWTGWLLDGGVPLILAYVAALLAAVWAAWRIARRPIAGPDGDVAIWGALLLAYNAGAIAATFNGTFFIGQSGMEFWLLNAALFVAAGTASLPKAVRDRLRP